MAPEGLRQLVRGRRRLEMLDADLAWYGVAPSGSKRPVMPILSTTAELLGAMYVMEGSALGGQVIARHLEQVLHLDPGHGNAYFRGFGELTRPKWLEFCDAFECNIADGESEGAISGAREMFGIFELWMSRFEGCC